MRRYNKPLNKIKVIKEKKEDRIIYDSTETSSPIFLRNLDLNRRNFTEMGETNFKKNCRRNENGRRPRQKN